MANKKANSALNAYAQNKTQGDVSTADPHRLVQLLFEGAIDKVVKAKYHMAEGNIQEKAEFISWAISILDGLKMSLDVEAGGEVANNLEALYEYMQSQLLKANAENNTEYLDEVTKLIKSIKSAWDEIPAEHHKTSTVASVDMSTNITNTTA